MASRPAPEQLLRDERAALLRRRRQAGFGNAQARALPTVGLALSGGGVRSATFALGLVRGLAAQRLLGRVDYLSSVSGGGFTAAMLGRLVCGIGIQRAQEELADGRSKVLDWLRRNGRYLSPAGARDLGIAAVSYLRAFLAIHLETFFALVPLALLVTLPHLGNDVTRWLDPIGWGDWASPWLALALAWLALTAPALLVGFWAAPEQRGGAPRRVYVGDVVLLLALIGATVAASRAEAAALAALREAELVRPLLLLALASATLGHGYAMVRLALARDARVLVVARLRNRLTRALRVALLGALALAGMGLLDRASWWLLQQFSAAEQPTWLWGGLGVGGTILVVLRALAVPLQQLAAKAINDRALALGPRLLDIAGRLATVVLVLAWLVVAQWWIFAQAPFDWLRPFPAWMRWCMPLVAALAWWLYTSRFAQAANASSLHGFYMARLVRAYLAVGNARRGLWSEFTPRDARLRSVTEVADGDDVDLTAHRPELAGGPIQLVNTCLNQTRDDASGLFNADRKGTLLTASARALEVGPRASVRCSDAGAALREAPGAARTLGHWVAVSGAAAAPGAGSYTSTGWSLVMFLLGIRLGYWMRAPLWQPGTSASRLRAWLWRHAPKPSMLWGEASATFYGESEPWWYTSDGAHFENTGVYALIKRECDFIILSDASADPHYEFGDIENLVRKARIDLGAEIEFYPRAEAARLFSLAGSGISVLSPDDIADDTSGRGVLLARIRYRGASGAGGEREGTLLVIKPCLHAALDLDLLAYARRHPHFPHDSTADQFFDEAQWESYQRLGEDLGLALYDRWLGQLPGWDRPQLHKLAAPAPLRRAAEAPADGGARRNTRAAVIGGSVGLGAVGALLLGLWQAQEQIQRSNDVQRQAVQQVLTEVAKELRDMPSACPRPTEYTVIQVARLRAVQDSAVVTPQDQQTLTLLLGAVTRTCARIAGGAGDCPAGDAEIAQSLCALVNKPAGEADVLAYWDPPLRPPDTVRSLRQAWALLIGQRPASEVAMAPPVTERAAPRTPTGSAGRAPAPAARPTQPLPAPPPPPPAAAQPSLVAPAPAPPAAALAQQAAPLCPVTPAPVCRAVTIYPQIYDDSARERVEALRSAFNGQGYRLAPVENVTRTAALRGQRRPVPWQQPTFIAHDASARRCAEEMARVLVQGRCWPLAPGGKPWVTDLPASLKAQPGALELWLPTPPQDRAAAR